MGKEGNVMKKIYAAVLVLLLVSCAPKEEAAVLKPLSIEDVPKSEATGICSSWRFSV